MTVDFTKLLSKTVDEEAKRPPSLPIGTYFGVIQKWEPKESDQKKTPFVRFFVQLTNAGEDIETSQLEGIDFTKRQLRRDFFLTEDAMYRLHEFFKSADIEFVGRSLSEALSETVGKNVIVTVNLRPNQQDPTAPGYNEISDMKGVTE